MNEYTAFPEQTRASPRISQWASLVASCLCGLVVGIAATSFLGKPVVSFSSETIAPACAETDAPLHKYAVSHMTPIELQMMRGTCWLFSLTALLEQSYRTQGIAAGYLKPDQYLRLSEQAVGAIMLSACTNNDVCKTGDGDEVWTGNSTEGGEVEWVYFLQKTVGRKAALPWSVCPYVPTPTSDAVCVGYEKAHGVSPLSFSVPSLTTHYDLEDIKQDSALPLP